MFLISREFARESGLPLKFVRKLCRAGTIPHINVGSSYYIDAESAKERICKMAREGVSNNPSSYLEMVEELQKKHGYPSK